MTDEHYRLSSGREVSLSQLHVHHAAPTFLLGTPQIIHRKVLKGLPSLVARLFRRDSAFVLHSAPACPLPRYLFLAEFVSGEAVRPRSDFSDLVVVWFANEVPKDLGRCIAGLLREVDWESHAVDRQW